MKKIIIIFVFIISLNSNLLAFDQTYTTYKTLLDSTLSKGLVDYKRLQKEPLYLQNAIKDFSDLTQPEYDRFNRSEKIAYMINAYNLFTIEGIVKNYPVKSIKDIKGFWNKTKHKVAGQMLTLDNIEHDILRKEFKEERIHVAVVCASISCPELWDQPFTADSLDNQLTARSKNFATDSTRNKIDFKENKLIISKILDWYGKDFEKKYSDSSVFPYLYGKKRAVANFIYQHLPSDMQIKFQTGKFKVGYLSYNWNLNEF